MRLRLASCLLLITSVAYATDYEIDPNHSAAQFAVRHMALATVRGQFNKVTGTISYDPNNLAASHVEAVVDVATVDTRVPGRDQDLKSDHFFDVAKYPTLNFKSKQFYRESGALKVKGDLSMHGVTKEVVLTVDGPSPEIKDPFGNQRVGASATTKINRQDWGLNWNATTPGGDAVVSDEVTITLDLEAVVKKPAGGNR
jgi:polyisoprenoid-binding protein YceI